MMKKVLNSNNTTCIDTGFNHTDNPLNIMIKNSQKNWGIYPVDMRRIKKLKEECLSSCDKHGEDDYNE